MINTDLLQLVLAYLRHSQSILFITGAGVSAESGLPTYRGVGGLYNNGLTEEGLSFEVALSGAMLAQQPQVTWKVFDGD